MKSTFCCPKYHAYLCTFQPLIISGHPNQDTSLISTLSSSYPCIYYISKKVINEQELTDGEGADTFNLWKLIDAKTQLVDTL